jgi:hypothetical protein
MNKKVGTRVKDDTLNDFQYSPDFSECHCFSGKKPFYADEWSYGSLKE